jgi:hypothetical protein
VNIGEHPVIRENAEQFWVTVSIGSWTGFSFQLPFNSVFRQSLEKKVPVQIEWVLLFHFERLHLLECSMIFRKSWKVMLFFALLATS